MAYMVKWVGASRQSPASAKTALDALAIGEEVEAGGATDVQVHKLGDDKPLPLDQHAVQRCGRSKAFNPNA